MNRNFFVVLLAVPLLLFFGPNKAVADGSLANVNHIIMVMQENHSYDRLANQLLEQRTHFLG